MPAKRILFLMILAAVAVPALHGCRDDGSDRSRYTRSETIMEALTYPETRLGDQTDDYHGTVVADPYRWLEDVDSDETHAWVEAQNAVTFDFLDGIPARETYKERLTDIWNYERYSAPRREGGRTFFYKNDGLQNQSVFYVQDGPDAEPRVLLDPNTLSDDQTVSLGGTSVAKDGRWLAWAKSVSGSDWHTWYIRDVTTGEDLDDEIEWSKFSGAAWDPAGEGFYYSRYDAPADGETYEGANYYQKLYYHERGTAQDEDVLVYERPDEKEWGFGGEVSEDGRYLVISVWQGTSRNNRLFYKDLQDPAGEIVEFLAANDARYGFVGNDGATFFILTNNDAPRQRLVAVDLDTPEPEHWRELVPESPNPLIET